MTQNSQTCSRRFERVREGSRGFEILRPAREGSRGFERVREGSRNSSQTCSRRFERVREGSRGFETGDRGTKLVRDGRARRQLSKPAARGGRPRLRVFKYCTDVASWICCITINLPANCLKIIFSCKQRMGKTFLKEALSAYGAYEKMSKIWRIVLAFVIFKILFNI